MPSERFDHRRFSEESDDRDFEGPTRGDDSGHEATIKDRLEQQAVILEDFGKCLEVLHDRLSPVLLRPQEKSSNDPKMDDTPGGYSHIQDKLREHNEELRRFINYVNSITHLVDL